MIYKAVFHMDMNDESLINLGLNNITNLLMAIPEHDHELVMLLNGPAVSLMDWDNCLGFLERIKDLHGKGVRFQVCKNALEKFEVSPDNLIPECEIIPAGIVALIDLQNDGYSYIKP